MGDSIEREGPGLVHTCTNCLKGNGEIGLSLTGDRHGAWGGAGGDDFNIPPPSPFRGLAFSISVRTDRVG